jgi:hypothetical protein
MNIKERVLIPDEFENFTLFNDNEVAWATTDGDKWGIIDKRGRFIDYPSIDGMRPFYNGMAAVISGNVFGVIDTRGKYIVNPRYPMMGATPNEIEYMKVNTDFFDAEAVVEAFVQPTGTSGFREIDATYTFADWKKKYGNFGSLGLSESLSAKSIVLTGEVNIEYTKFRFRDILEREEYSFYDRRTNRIEALHSPIQFVDYQLLIRSFTKRKQEALVEALKNKIERTYPVSATSASDDSIQLSGQQLSFNIMWTGENLHVRIYYNTNL